MSKLRDEIKQTKPFASLEVEAVLNIVFTAEVLQRAAAEVLKPADLTPTQYNVLRILRGAGESGLACGEIAERLIHKDPDITRLIDRMVDRGLVLRGRSEKDRRVVTVRVTAKGARLAAEMDGPLLEQHRRQLGHLGESRLKKLIELLEAAREAAE
ncbi:MAG TPA: MarR family transcriptional regulator [Planctomycetota bacterium]|nr:MarR family transcriptional regulator [Planctomycetota bacterium]